MITSNDEAHRWAMDSALLLLKFRGRSEREMSQGLGRKGVLPKIIQRTVTRLRELGLLDDLSLARRWVESAQDGGQGQERIRQALWKRGIPHDIIERVLAETVRPEDEAKRAWDVLRRQMSRLKNLNPKALRRRCWGGLIRQGFSQDVAQDALEKFFWEENE